MTNETEQCEHTTEQSIERMTVNAVTWTDDDGTTYRRTIQDGEIIDHEVKA